MARYALTIYPYSLCGNFYVLNSTAGFWDRQAILLHPFQMKLDCRADFSFDFFHRLTGCDTPGEIRNVG